MGFNLIESILNNPSYVFMRSMARFSTVRHAVSKAHSVLNSKKKYEFLATEYAKLEHSIFPDIDIERHVRNIREDGYSAGLKLPIALVDEIHKEIENKKVYAFRDPRKGFYNSNLKQAEKKLGKGILLSQYFNVQKIHAISKVINDPALKLIAAKYLDAEPKFLGSVLWWTYPTQTTRQDQFKHAHFYHRDVDDYKFIKFFFYLNDVNKGDGAHWLVAGSHRKPLITKFSDYFRIRRYEDSEVIKFYGENNIIEMTGMKGDGFAEDTLCVHKAASPSFFPRLVLHVQFGLYNHVPEYDLKDEDKLADI